MFLPVVVVFMIQSMTKRKRKSDSRHPCQTPVFTSKLFRQLAGVGNSAAHVLKGTPDEGDYLLRDSIVSQ